MSDCKHNRIIDHVKNGSILRDLKEYYCTQCQKWVFGPNIMRAADARKKSEELQRERRRS